MMTATSVDNGRIFRGGNVVNADDSHGERIFNSQNTLRGLRLVERALLAMPKKELAKGHLASRGRVCLLGAALVDWDVSSIEEGIDLLKMVVDIGRDDGMSEVETACFVAKDWLGLSESLSLRLQSLNDEALGSMSPARRYDEALSCVRHWIRMNQVHTAEAKGRPISTVPPCRCDACEGSYEAST